MTAERVSETNIKAARAVPIADVWRRLGLPEAAEGKAFCSPFRPDKNPSCQLGGSKNIFFDHAGGVSHDPVGLARAVKGCSFAEAISFILGRPTQPGAFNPSPRSFTATAEEPTKQKMKHVWDTPAEAEKAFERLPLASGHPGALEMLERDYGLNVAAIPDTWRVGHYPGIGEGVVYLGFRPDLSPVYSFRSLARDAKGKRESRFLHGDAAGALLLTGNDTLIVVAGQEKGLAAFQAGYSVLCPFGGEKPLGEGWTRFIAEKDFARVVVANDADAPGAKANAGTVEALKAVGIPGERLSVVSWPEGSKPGADLNDIFKEGGVEGLRAFLEAAPLVEKPEIPRAVSLANFLAVDRPPLEYFIEGILPRQGKMTICATAKGFKTVLAQEIGLCLAQGRTEYLSFRMTGPGVRVLMCQPELSDGLMEERTKWILRTAPHWLNKQAALENFFLFQNEHGRPNLATDAGRRVVEKELERVRPDVLIADPLYMLFPGLEENAAESMTLALDYLGGLTVRFGVAVILTHHFGKNGTSRGSSVIQGWGETDLSISGKGEPADEDFHLEVRALLRCSFGRDFPGYWEKHESNPDSAWFQRMDAPPEKGGSNPKVQTFHIFTVLKAAKGFGLSHNALMKEVALIANASGRTAKRAIAEAKEKGKILLVNGLYTLPESGEKT